MEVFESSRRMIPFRNWIFGNTLHHLPICLQQYFSKLNRKTSTTTGNVLANNINYMECLMYTVTKNPASPTICFLASSDLLILFAMLAAAHTSRHLVSFTFMMSSKYCDYFYVLVFVFPYYILQDILRKISQYLSQRMLFCLCFNAFSRWNCI